MEIFLSNWNPNYAASPRPWISRNWWPFIFIKDSVTKTGRIWLKEHCVFYIPYPLSSHRTDKMFQELHLSGWVWKYSGKISLKNTTRWLKSNNLILFQKEAECEKNCKEYEFSPSFSSFKRWLIKCWVKIIKYNCVCLSELWYSKKMRLFQNWGKNYPVDDVYSLITANTNKLDGYGEVQIH